jgi:hypothetical protein
MAEPFPGGLTVPEDWFNGILPRAPGMGDDFIKQELLTVLSDFCARSGIWQDWLPVLPLEPGVCTYSIETTDYKASIVKVLFAYRYPSEIPLSTVEPSDYLVDAEAQKRPGDPAYIHMTPERLLFISPPLPEGVEDSVRIYATLRPLDLCVPDWIKINYYDDICNGVLGRLYLTPGPLYKADLGVRMEKRYKAQRDRAQAEALGGNTAGEERVIPRPTFARGTGLCTRGTYHQGYAGTGPRYRRL